MLYEHGSFQQSVVLVVDDQPHVRELICESLRGDGAITSSCASCEDALELLGQTDTFTHLISDLNFPCGMSGAELAARARSIEPALTIVLMSGSGARPESLPASCSYLPKPFRLREMMQALFS